MGKLIQGILGAAQIPALGADDSDDGQSIGLTVFDHKQLCKFRNCEDFVNLGPDVREDELGAVLLHALVKTDQLSQRGAGEKLNVGKIQDDFLAILALDQLVELLAEFLDLCLIDDLRIRERHDRDRAGFVDFNSSPCRHGTSFPYYR